MSPEAWFTLAVVVAIFVALVREIYSPASAMAGGLAVLFLGGSTPLLDEFFPAELAFAGFASKATITIAALYVVAWAVRSTGVVDRMLLKILGGGVGDRRLLARVVGPVAVSSAFLNNTPIVATLAPLIRDWAEARDKAPSRYLMPLSFAAILGGTMTSIGTSTTLVVSGAISNPATFAMKPFSLFEVSAVGIPVAILGGLAVVMLAPKLLPDRVAPSDGVQNSREYAFQMRVEAGGALDGTIVEDAGLRNLAGVYLVRLDRGAETIAPVAPTQVLRGGDQLTFAGRVSNVRDLEQIAGLVSAEEEHYETVETKRAFRFYEAVVGPRSSLAGRTLKEIGFRARYGAAVMAIHRAGERLDTKLGQVPLRSGDVLLLVGPPGAQPEWEAGHDFLLVNSVFDRPKVEPRRAALIFATIVGMVLIAGTGILSILQASLLAVMVLAVTKTIRLSDARDSIDLDVILIVAAALGIGAAVEASGLAALAAESIAELAGGSNQVVALAIVMLGTVLMTELISNAAAASIMIQIALPVAAATGIDPRGAAIAVALMASASFLTPVGYQTNTIVYGIGGYKYTDYWKFGLPISLISFAVTLTMVSLVF